MQKASSLHVEADELNIKERQEKLTLQYEIKRRTGPPMEALDRITRPLPNTIVERYKVFKPPLANRLNGLKEKYQLKESEMQTWKKTELLGVA